MNDISYNFGAIRDSVAKLSSIELMRENKSATLDSFIKRTNESPNLKKQQLIYKNIQECKPFSKERLAERFLNQNLSMFRNSKWHDMMFENKQVRYDLLGAPDVSHIGAREHGKLFEAINTLIESVSNPGFSNFELEGLAYEMVLEHLMRDVSEEEKTKEVNDAPSMKNAWRFVTKLAVNNFNERYEHLNDSEKEVLSVLISSNVNKKEYLEDVKNENINIINSLLEGSIDKMKQDILIEFRGKIEKMDDISPLEIDEYILECLDLRQNLNELK